MIIRQQDVHSYPDTLPQSCQEIGEFIQLIY